MPPILWVRNQGKGSLGCCFFPFPPPHGQVYGEEVIDFLLQRWLEYRVFFFFSFFFSILVLGQSDPSSTSTENRGPFSFFPPHGSFFFLLYQGVMQGGGKMGTGPFPPPLTPIVWRRLLVFRKVSQFFFLSLCQVTEGGVSIVSGSQASSSRPPLSLNR